MVLFLEGGISRETPLRPPIYFRSVTSRAIKENSKGLKVYELERLTVYRLEIRKNHMGRSCDLPFFWAAPAVSKPEVQGRIYNATL
jgi:hypothetical protein